MTSDGSNCLFLFLLCYTSNVLCEEVLEAFLFGPSEKIKSHQLYNPTDKLSKFDLDKDSSDLWVRPYWSNSQPTVVAIAN